MQETASNSTTLYRKLPADINLFPTLTISRLKESPITLRMIIDKEPPYLPRYGIDLFRPTKITHKANSARRGADDMISIINDKAKMNKLHIYRPRTKKLSRFPFYCEKPVRCRVKDFVEIQGTRKMVF